MRLAILGSGYVGLVSGACFAEFGHSVECVDKDARRIDALLRGEMPIFEPGLAGIVERNVAEGRLEFSTNGADAIANADVVFIAVGTPTRRGDGAADLSYVYSAAEEIAANLNGFTVVVTKSTVPVGTGDEVEALIKKCRPDADVAVVSNPEFLREGNAIEDFKRPDRIVIGTDDSRARTVMEAVYRPIATRQSQLLLTGRRTSELIKYAGNGFLAMKITFINEIADLCEKLDADVEAVAEGIGLDRRIGPDFLRAGPGYGGSCFPKDTLALMSTSERFGAPLSLIDTTIQVNNRRKKTMASRIVAAMGGEVRGKSIGVLGLTFKADTDDMRESPSLSILPELHMMGASIKAFDPHAECAAIRQFEGVRMSESIEEVTRNVDAVVVITDWDQFRAIDFEELKLNMRGNTIVDLRNIYYNAGLADLGFDYYPIGRKPNTTAKIASDQGVNQGTTYVAA